MSDEKTNNFNSSSDGRVINNLLIDSFTASVENFNGQIAEAENNLPSQLLIDLMGSLMEVGKWDRKASEIEVFFISFVLDIKHDYLKSLQHLLQGFVSDHYFFMRRAIENVQLLLFLKEKVLTDDDFVLLLQLDTDEYKKKLKYRDWFAAKRNHLKSKYAVKMKAYEDCCNLGVHVNLMRKSLMQSFVVNDEKGNIEVKSQFHDARSVTNNIPMPILLCNVHLVFWDITRLIYDEKIFPRKQDSDKAIRFITRLEGYKKSMKEYYQIHNPEIFKSSF